MLFTIAVILVVLWALGLVSGTTIGGLVHILLVLAVIMVVFQLISGRKIGWIRSTWATCRDQHTTALAQPKLVAPGGVERIPASKL